MEEIQPFTWMKAKYRSEKTKGKFKSGTNTSSKRSSRKKNPKALKPDFRMHLYITSGKRRWVKEPIEAK